MKQSNSAHLSDQLVRLVQVVFGVVIAQSLMLNREIVIHPFSLLHRTSGLALLAVYITTVMSWIDWHESMEQHPYRVEKRGDRYRLAFDLSVVVIYSYLLFTIDEFRTEPAADLTRHLFGYPLVFLGYLFSGLVRRHTYHSSSASSILLIILGILLFLILLVVYALALRGLIPMLGMNPSKLNFYTLSLVIGLMSLYRWVRRKYKEKTK